MKEKLEGDSERRIGDRSLLEPFENEIYIIIIDIYISRGEVKKIVE